ncbi:MAG: hypothetical protein AAFW74_02685 [Pseudomonadota bacterium]
MFKLYSRKADFKAEVTILTAPQGGRETPPFNGIRWDFRYPEDDLSEGIYMIHPIFLDENKAPIPGDQPLSGTIDAFMFILGEEMLDFHRERISVETEFYCVEGSRTVATGKVTKLIALDTQ